MEQEIQTTYFNSTDINNRVCYVSNRSDRPIKVVFEDKPNCRFTYDDDNAISWIMDMKLDLIGDQQYFVIGHANSDFAPDEREWEKLLIDE